MNGGNVIFHFKGETKELEKSTLSVGDIIKGSLASKAIVKGLQAVNENLDGAIKRVDIMNNFPNIMGNLGIGADESARVIQKLSDKLTGLPTALDSAVGAVTRFTTKNSDLSKSAEMFLAVNNAILAGGASTEIQASALEQLSQAYAKGKPDMMEWRSLLTAMPAQLNQVAKAMGMTTDALGESLRKGDISMDDFINTIMKLNTEGVDGLANFEEQARSATGGIRTSLTNLKTAIVRGIANTINTINTSLQNAGLPTISEIIQNISKKINVLFANIQKLVPLLVKISPLIMGVVSAIATYKIVSGGLKILALAKNIGKASIAFIQLIKSIKSVNDAMLLLNITFGLNPIVLIVAAIIGLVTAFVILWKKSEKFRNFWIGLWEGIKNVFSKVWKSITGFFTNTIPTAFNNFISFLRSIPTKISEFVETVISHIKKIPYYLGYALGYVAGLIAKAVVKSWNFITKTLPEMLRSFGEAVINFFTSLPGKIWNGLVLCYNKIKEFGINVWNWLVNAFNSVTNWIINLKYSIRDGVINIINTIIEWFKKLPSNMYNIGSNIVKGLWNGIKNSVQWLHNKIKEFSSGVLKGFKKAFGVHSPSTEFAYVGKMNMIGLEKGMEDMQPEIQRSIDGMFDLSPSLYGNTSANLSPVVNVTTNVDIEQDNFGQFVKKIKTYSGGSKNDYNYGMGV